jgi:hypothetical protein
MKSALVLSLLIPLSASAATYEMADLKALDKDQSWRELVDHLLDIVPSKRDADWKAIAERACVGVLDPAEIKDEKSGARALEQIDELMKRFPWLKDSKSFLSKRAEVGFKAMGWTFSSSRHSSGDDPWMDRLKTFVAADNMTPDLPLRAIKLTNSRLVAVVAFPFVKPALAKGGKAACKDSELQQSILGAITEGSWATEAAEVTTTCWDELKPLVIAETIKPEQTRTMQLKLCPVLDAKKAITTDQVKKACTFN